MNRTLGRSLVAAVAVAIAAGAASAADAPQQRYGYRPAPHPRHQVRTAPLGAECDEAWGGSVLLRCPRQVVVTPSKHDIVAWNELTVVETRQPRPYSQLFNWSR